MSAYTVQVEYDRYDDVPTDEFLGYFRSRATAQAFADRLTAALPEAPGDDVVHVTVRLIHDPRIRPTVRQAREFYGE